ncbi:ferritin [Paenibacillus sp. DS2015]|uniref:hypothetical protein n=1 Tax=Paenibacillus sp. DS2015 TaxID=3373917 RepID=UPI003D1F93A0
MAGFAGRDATKESFSMRQTGFLDQQEEPILKALEKELNSTKLVNKLTAKIMKSDDNKKVTFIYSY